MRFTLLEPEFGFEIRPAVVDQRPHVVEQRAVLTLERALTLGQRRVI